MKEITKTIVEKYNDNGVLIERSETTTEKDLTIEKQYVPIPYHPSIPNYPNVIWTGDAKPIEYTITCGTGTIKTEDLGDFLNNIKRTTSIK